MARSPPAKSIAAAPNGLFGAPAGIRLGKFGLLRLTTVGGTHAGRRSLPLMKVVPPHCLPARPTPTVYHMDIPPPYKKCNDLTLVRTTTVTAELLPEKPEL